MLYYVVLVFAILFIWLIKRKGNLIMKFNYVKTENMPVSIETDLNKLRYIKDALEYFKNSNDVNNPVSQYDARKIYDEINVVISRINESIKY